MNPFDHIARDYDQVFTHSEIGKIQRAQVYQYLETQLPKQEDLRILELNCGTGEDAIWLAEKGHFVMATDISPEMVSVTRHKAMMKGLGNHIQAKNLSLEQFGMGSVRQRFDWVFSNFGGINCIDEEKLSKVIHEAANILHPGGRLIMVIMSRMCIWETAYFMTKGKWKKAFQRRKKGPVLVDLEGETFPIWYYSPKDMIELALPNFEVETIKPIGFWTPPSYLENFFSKRPQWLNRLGNRDLNGWNHPFFAGLSDHFLIDLRLQ